MEWLSTALGHWTWIHTVPDWVSLEKKTVLKPVLAAGTLKIQTWQIIHANTDVWSFCSLFSFWSAGSRRLWSTSTEEDLHRRESCAEIAPTLLFFSSILLKKIPRIPFFSAHLLSLQFLLLYSYNISVLYFFGQMKTMCDCSSFPSLLPLPGLHLINSSCAFFVVFEVSFVPPHPPTHTHTHTSCMF